MQPIEGESHDKHSRGRFALLAAGVVTGPAAQAGPAPAATGTPAGGTLLGTLGGNLYLIKPDGTHLRRLTSGGGIGDADFSPDGRRIAFTKGTYPTRDLYLMNADGTGVTRLTSTPTRDEANPSFSPDGTKIVYGLDLGASRRGGIAVMAARPGASPRVVVANVITTSESRVNSDPDWSPSDGLILYTQRYCPSAGGCDDLIKFVTPTGVGVYQDDYFRANQGSFATRTPRLFAGIQDIEYTDQNLFTFNLRTGYGTTWTAEGLRNPTWAPDDRNLAVNCSFPSGGASGALCLVPVNGAPVLIKDTPSGQLIPRAWRSW